VALAELRVRLNPSELVSSFTTDLRGATGALESIGVPVDASGVANISASAKVDLSSLSQAAQRISAELAASPIALPNAGALVGDIEGMVALLEELDLRAIDSAVRGVLEQARTAMLAGGGTRVDVILEQLTATLGASPQGQQLMGVLSRLLQLAGADGGFLNDAKRILPAGLALVRAMGGLMRVESALSEAERLSHLLRDQLARDRTVAELRMVEESLAHALDRLRAAAADPAVMDEADVAGRDALARLDLVQESIARRFAFAESTLLYADLAGTLAEVQAGLADAAGVDVAGAGAAIGAMVERVMPALSIPLPPSPADSFEALLQLVEREVAGLATKIEGLNVERVGAPVATLMEKVTIPIRELQRLHDELVHAADGATQQVTALINALPTQELADAINTATAPVRAAMTAVSDAVAALQASLGTAAGAATSALDAAESAVNALMAALQALMGDAATFVQELGVDRAIGELQERLRQVAAALEKANVAPYFSAADDAIDTTASVLEKVPVIMLPDDIKAEFDALVEPLRSLNVDATAGEVESWFELQEDGTLPFAVPVEAAIDEVQGALQALLAELEPLHPQLLAPVIDAELEPVRAQASRLDLSGALAPVEEAIASLKRGLDGVDPAAALAPVSAVIAEAASKLDLLDPDTLLAPLQARVVEVREAVITTLKLEQASQALGDLEREAIRLVTLLDPARLEPMIADGFAVAQRELQQLDAATMGSWGSILVTSLLSGDGSKRRPTSWAMILDALTGKPVTGRLSARAQAISAAVTEASATTASLDLAATTVTVTQRLREMGEALAALPADSPVRLSLAPAVARRGANGGLARLEENRARFSTELQQSHAPAAALLQLELSRVDVTAAAINAAAAPIRRLRDQLLGFTRQLGLKKAGDGIGAILGEVMAVATPARLAGILVPIFTAVRGRAAALLASVIGPVRAAIDGLVALLRSLDLLRLTQGVKDVIAAGKAQVMALDPAALLAPTLATFATLKGELQAFDPLAPVRQLLDALKGLITRLLGTPGEPGTLSAARILTPASALFDELIEILRSLDPEPLMRPLLDALTQLATDIRDGVTSLRDGLKRLQEAIPSTEGLALSAVVDVDVDLGF